MGCCGKIKTLKNIVVGHSFLMLDAVLPADPARHKMATERIRKCYVCEKCTWLRPDDFLAFVVKNVGRIIKHLDELEKLPELPKERNDARGKLPFCMLCKCNMRAKVQVEDAECPEKKW